MAEPGLVFKPSHTNTSRRSVCCELKKKTCVTYTVKTFMVYYLILPFLLLSLLHLVPVEVHVQIGIGILRQNTVFAKK